MALAQPVLLQLCNMTYCSPQGSLHCSYLQLHHSSSADWLEGSTQVHRLCPIFCSIFSIPCKRENSLLSAAVCTLSPSLLLHRPVLLGCYAIISPGVTASLQAWEEIPLTRQTREEQGQSRKVPGPFGGPLANDQSEGGEGEEWRCKDRHTHRRRRRQNTHGERQRDREKGREREGGRNTNAQKAL
uniref:Uncharacterized protein n=1 Tax=Apteryx owenii TaxID=8824 RepID=A0A8B9QKT4_APTOW